MNPLDDEEAWVNDLTALFWPLNRILKIDPFIEDLTPNQRLNAHARLMLLLCAGMYYATVSRGENGFPILFWTLLYMTGQGVSYMQSADGKRQLALDRAIRNVEAEKLQLLDQIQSQQMELAQQKYDFYQMIQAERAQSTGIHNSWGL